MAELLRDPLSATENMTLGDMRKRDIDNLTLLLQRTSAKEYAFESLQDGRVFTSKGVQAVMLKFGINKDEIIRKALSLPMDDFGLRMFIRDYDGPPLNPKIDIRKIYAAKVLNDAQNSAGIKTEVRAYDDKADRWRSGFYLYHDNEIAYFFSNVYQRKGGHYTNGHIIVPAYGKYFVLTNYKEG